MKIKVHMRSNGIWMAFFESDPPRTNSYIADFGVWGFGKTEAEAVADLKFNLQLKIQRLCTCQHVVWGDSK